MVLSDDRLLRKTAVIEGLGVIGTLGVLLRASKNSLLEVEATKRLIQQLVEDHNFRISTTVYDAALRALPNLINQCTIGAFRPSNFS